jgi:hypothetical protein
VVGLGLVVAGLALSRAGSILQGHCGWVGICGGWAGVFASRLAPTGECGLGVMSLDAEYEAGGFAWDVVEIAEALHADLFQDAD